MSALPPPTVMQTIAKSELKTESPKRKFTQVHKLGLGLIFSLALMVAVAAYLIYASYHETTDDAYTTGHVHNISSRVAGTVAEVAVDDNEFVKKGQVLARLDPRDFQVQVDKAQADYKRAKADFERVSALRKSFNGDVAISKQEADQIEANLGVAQAALDDAIDQLGYCTITAPEDGYVGDKTVQTGNRVAVGTVLMSVVQDVWVVANYKETQVGEMLKGQKVRITVDEISHHTFTGTIDSFSPGSGSVFALLPPENATGNFTKIVQRVPVKIVLDQESVRGYEQRLVPGLSVETDVSLTFSSSHANVSPGRDALANAR
ncbi:MAG TPA: HlyD family secretion protein [Candidatus Methylacidiphilales bacterium]